MTRVSQAFSLRKMLEAIRASLLARAVANLLRWSRGAAFSSRTPKLKRSPIGRVHQDDVCGLYEQGSEILLPRLEMRARIDRPPVPYWRGTDLLDRTGDRAKTFKPRLRS